jgi:hypothetical protein
LIHRTLPSCHGGAFLVARLFLASRAHNTSVVTFVIVAGSVGRLWLALLPAMLSALILPAFEIVLFGHLKFSDGSGMR